MTNSMHNKITRINIKFVNQINALTQEFDSYAINEQVLRQKQILKDVLQLEKNIVVFSS